MFELANVKNFKNIKQRKSGIEFVKKINKKISQYIQSYPVFVHVRLIGTHYFSEMQNFLITSQKVDSQN